jgi:hypothetical protein
MKKTILALALLSSIATFSQEKINKSKTKQKY